MRAGSSEARGARRWASSDGRASEHRRGLRALRWALGLCGVFAITACGPTVRSAAPGGGGRKAAVAPAARPLDDPKPLGARRLEKLWDVFLGERLVGLWQLDDALYVQTSLNRLYAIGLRDGLVRWQYNVPSGLSFPPTGYTYEPDGLKHTNELFLITKDVLHVVDREHGFLLWKKKLPFAAASSPVGSYSHIYIGSWDQRLYAVSKEKHYVDWSYRTRGAVTALAEPTERSVESVFVASEDGILYSMNPVREERKWFLRTQAPLVASPLFYRNFVYVASRDMTLYCVRSVDGYLAWKLPTGAPLESKPVAFTRDLVYVHTTDDRLLAVERLPQNQKKHGYIRWSAPKTRGLLAHGRGDVYALSSAGRVVALDEKTGKERWQEPLSTGARLFTFNPYSTKSRRKRERDLSTIIGLGYDSGWVVAIKEKGEY